VSVVVPPPDNLGLVADLGPRRPQRRDGAGRIIRLPLRGEEDVPFG
jgi:hypothetical protein